jgi:hypothetical protein
MRIRITNWVFAWLGQRFGWDWAQNSASVNIIYHYKIYQKISYVCMSVTLKCKAMDANLHIWSIILNIYNVDKNKQTQWCKIKPLLSLRLGTILYYSEDFYLHKIYY